MRSTPHILVINGTKVRRPVFILGSPHSGADVLARAVKRSAGFHLTAGRPNVLRLVYAYARRPSIATGRGVGAARVLRDAYAESWQITPGGCRECPADCRALAGLPPVPPGAAGRFRPDAGRPAAGRPAEEPCVEPRGVERFADATPDLLYSADVLLDAFPDAQFVQVIRDGRDVVAEMLADDGCLGWFRPGLSNLDEVFPNPFLGVEEEDERRRWPSAALAVKCALRWRGSVRLSARLRAQVPEDQLHTVRFEDLAAHPRRTSKAVSEYLEAPLSPGVMAGLVRSGAPADHTDPERRVGIWRDRLTPRQIVQVERIAGNELHRLGYRLSD